MPRNNILLRKVAIPIKVTLPNGRTFFAKYAMVSKRELPQNIRIMRKYVRKIGPRRQRKRRGQRGRSFAIPSQTILSTALEMGKKAGKTDLGQMVIKDAIDLVPTAYTKIKNKLFKSKQKASNRSSGGAEDFVSSYYN